MKKIFGALCVLACFAVFATASAAEFLAPSKDSGQVSVPQAETHKNLYTAGSQVTINGPTTGDLVVAGGMLILNAPVSGGLLAAGGNIASNAKVSGNSRIAGGNLTINAPVEGDLVVAGGNIVITASAPIGGDLVVAGGTVTVDAPVAGNVKIAGGSVTVNSKIGGEVRITATKELTFGPSADISQTVRYRGRQQASVDAAAKVAGVDFSRLAPRREGRTAGLLTVKFLIQLIAYAIAGFLFLHFWRNRFGEAAALIRSRPWMSLGVGLLGLIAIPVIIILLFVTVVGYYLGLVLASAFGLAMLVNTIVALLFLGEFVIRLFSKTAALRDWHIVLAGVVLWEVLKLIPIVGWLVLAIACLMSFGVILVSMKKIFARQ